MAKCKAFESLVFTCCNCGNNQAQEEDELHCFATPEAGVLDEPYSAKPAQPYQPARGRSFSQKIESAKLSWLTPGISSCSVESAVS